MLPSRAGRRNFSAKVVQRADSAEEAAGAVQVQCSPASPVTVFLQQLRLSSGGYVKLSVRGVAGVGTLRGVAIRTTPVAVRAGIVRS